VAGVVHSNSGTKVQLGKEESLVRSMREERDLTLSRTGSTTGNGKFIVIDFDSPDAIVFAGSSGFSDVGAAKNGNNVVAIHDPSIATQFAIQLLDMVDHYRLRAAAGRAAGHLSLDSTDRWVRPYYTAANSRFLERTILANAGFEQGGSHPGR
jgi:hypothetical protein